MSELYKERAERESLLECLALEVLTALGERDGAVREAERRVGDALRTMTYEEGMSARPPTGSAAASPCGQ